jgi:hypothetical protein
MTKRDRDIVRRSNAFNTNRTEVAPRSDVVRKDFELQLRHRGGPGFVGRCEGALMKMFTSPPFTSLRRSCSLQVFTDITSLRRGEVGRYSGRVGLSVVLRIETLGKSDCPLRPRGPTLPEGE